MKIKKSRYPEPKKAGDGKPVPSSRLSDEDVWRDYWAEKEAEDEGERVHCSAWPCLVFLVCLWVGVSYVAYLLWNY